MMVLGGLNDGYYNVDGPRTPCSFRDARYTKKSRVFACVCLFPKTESIALMLSFLSKNFDRLKR